MIQVSNALLRQHARMLFDAALDAVNPYRLMETAISSRRGDDTLTSIRAPAGPRDLVLLGAGKAVVAMSSAVLDLLEPRLLSGICIATQPVERTEKSGSVSVQYYQGGHPLPTSRGVQAAAAIRDLLTELDSGHIGGIIVLLSGGGSSLLTLPESPLTLADIRKTTELMLKNGADIHQLNTVRKHVLALAGGKLLRFSAVRPVLCYVLSDVVGDDLATIASGPTVPDPTTFRDACETIGSLGLRDALPRAVIDRLEQGSAGLITETPKPGDPLFDRTRTMLVGNNSLALKAMAEAAEKLGYKPIMATDLSAGSVSALVTGHGARLSHILNPRSGDSSHGSYKRFALLSGGEGTITVRGAGRGGRNSQFVLEMVRRLDGLPVCVLSAGTDGVDGSSDAAGAIADGDTLSRAGKLGMTPEPFSADNDAHRFFSRLDDLIVTGPTGTNVMDVRIILGVVSDTDSGL